MHSGSNMQRVRFAESAAFCTRPQTAQPTTTPVHPPGGPAGRVPGWARTGAFGSHFTPGASVYLSPCLFPRAIHSVCLRSGAAAGAKS